MRGDTMLWTEDWFADGKAYQWSYYCAKLRSAAARQNLQFGGYVIPRTSVLGAILLTGYLGGATATQVRVGDAFFAPVVVGVLVWGGLFLRDQRLRALIPLRR